MESFFKKGSRLQACDSTKKELPNSRSQMFRCSLKFRNVYKKTSVLESLFDKVAGLSVCNFIKKRL